MSVEGLAYTYPGGDRPAVRDLGFQMAEGEIFGFLCPSAAGNSTRGSPAEEGEDEDAPSPPPVGGFPHGGSAEHRRPSTTAS